MPDLTDDQQADAHKRFEELGPEQLHTLVSTGGLPARWHLPAIHWLAAKERAGKEDAAK